MQLHSCQNCRWISRSIIGELSLKHSVPHNKQSVPEGVLSFYISLSHSPISCLISFSLPSPSFLPSLPLLASLPPSPCFPPRPSTVTCVQPMGRSCWYTYHKVTVSTSPRCCRRASPRAPNAQRHSVPGP